MVGILGAIMILSNRQLMQKLVAPLAKALIPDTYVDELRNHFHSFYDVLAHYRKNPKATLMAYGVALIFWWSIVMMATAVTKVLGIPGDNGFRAAGDADANAGGVIPISVSGLGTRDAIAIFVFGVAGVSAAQAVGFSLAYLVLGTYLTALFGFFFWLFRPRTPHSQS